MTQFFLFIIIVFKINHKCFLILNLLAIHIRHIALSKKLFYIVSNVNVSIFEYVLPLPVEFCVTTNANENRFSFDTAHIHIFNDRAMWYFVNFEISASNLVLHHLKRQSILSIFVCLYLVFIMETRYFPNKSKDFTGEPVEIDKKFYRTLIKSYVRQIIENTAGDESRGDLYVGDSGERTISSIVLFE